MEKGCICQKCGEIYTGNEHIKNNFCDDSRTPLMHMLKYKSMTEEFEGSGRHFDGLIKKFFPYSDFRPFQLKAIDFAYRIISEGKIGLMSSPCGTGKSISVLTAFFAAREVNPSLGRLLVLTRTKNQLEIYSRELKNIKAHCSVSFVASIFKSKKEMCPHAIEDPKLRDISYRDFLYYCKGLKKGIFGKTCLYYDGTYDCWKPSLRARTILNKIKAIGPIMPEEVYEICCKEGLCPYEITKILSKYADIVIGNYNYLLVDAIRGSVLRKAGIKMKEINCVFDEAHSLPYYSAGIFSDEISLRSIRRAEKEAKTFELDPFGFLEAFYSVLVDFGKRVYKSYGMNAEHIISLDELLQALANRLMVNKDELFEIIQELAEKGEIVRQKKIEAGKSPVSYMSRCADFILNCLNLTGSSYVRYVKVEVDRDRKKSVKLGIRCLDPALASNVINELRSAILMSGTLWNQDYYIDVLGLERSRCQGLELPSPFPSKNRMIAVDMSVTTKFEKRGIIQWKRIAAHLNQIIEKVKGRVAVYFPSYEVMDEVIKAINPKSQFLVEGKGTKISDVLAFLRNNNECLILGVARGKISEGVDMTEEGRGMLSAVIIVGLPFPKKTELQLALYRYFKEKFKTKALEYANDIPCLNALAQSAGRLLRSPEDRGIIIIMDRRAAGGFFKRRLPEDWNREMKAHFKIEKIICRIEDFMGKSS
jgi:DNA excision repair protein ERCC-2